MSYCVSTGPRTILVCDSELDVVLGRSSYCTLLVDDASVSRIHAMLRLVGDELELSDLGSTCGTFLNGTRIDGPVFVRPGDDVRLGDQPLLIAADAPRPSIDTQRAPPHDPERTELGLRRLASGEWS